MRLNPSAERLRLLRRQMLNAAPALKLKLTETEKILSKYGWTHQDRSSIADYNSPLVESECYLRGLLSANPVILEIGCNDGEDSVKLLNLFDQVRLFCFEPE